MKRIMILAGAFSAVLGANAQSFIVSGKTDATLNDKMAYLIDLENKRTVLDSALVKNGTFELKFQSATPRIGMVGIKEKGVQAPTVVIDNEPLRLTWTGNEVTSIEGSALNRKFEEAGKMLSPYEKELAKLGKEYRTVSRQEGGKDKAKAIEIKYDSLDNVKNDMVYKICMDNTDNLIASYYLVRSSDALGDERVEALLATKGKFMEHAFMKKYLAQREEAKKTAVGQQFVDFSMPDVNGQVHKLSDYVGNGKYLFVDFWASWCGPCRAEIPNVKKVYEKYKDKGLAIVGISLDSKEADWKKAIETLGLAWPQLSDVKGWQCEGAALYSVRAIPATVLIDPSGKIIARNLRGEEMEKKFAELFK